MIQRMERAGRKGGQSTFIFFSPTWSKVDDLDEVEKRLAPETLTASTQAVKPLHMWKSARPSPLSQSIKAKDVSDSESVANSVDGDLEAEFDVENVSNADLEDFSLSLAKEADKHQLEARRKSHANRTRVAK